VHGDDHRTTIRGLHNLASLYRKQGRQEEARAAEPEASAKTKNTYASLALNCEPADLRDSSSALRFALEANELTNFEKLEHSSDRP